MPWRYDAIVFHGRFDVACGHRKVNPRYLVSGPFAAYFAWYSAGGGSYHVIGFGCFWEYLICSSSHYLTSALNSTSVLRVIDTSCEVDSVNAVNIVNGTWRVRANQSTWFVDLAQLQCALCMRVNSVTDVRCSLSRICRQLVTAKIEANSLFIGWSQLSFSRGASALKPS